MPEFRIPNNLERELLTRGPVALRGLVAEVGGLTASAKVARISPATLHRWVHEPPGRVFGSRGRVRSYRSVWPGYPPPFSGMDRVVERLCGEGSSFIGVLIGRHGVDGTFSRLVGHRGFGLDLLGFSDAELTVAAKATGAPNSSWRRWMWGCRYPSQWRALDRLAKNVGHDRWLLFVLDVDASLCTHQPPPGALLCLVNALGGSEARRGLMESANS